MIIGSDLGFYVSKTHLGVSFLSKVSKVGGIEETGDTLILDGCKYYLGEGEFETEYKKAYKGNLITLLYGSLALTSDDVHNKIVVGLPLSQYKEDKDYLRNRILQNSDKRVIINDVSKRIIIDDVEIVPESVASVPVEFEGIVIDIGGRTTDIALIVNESGRRKIKTPYSLPQGVLNLESQYINLINSKLGLDLMPIDANRILENGLKIYGEKQDISFAIQVFKDFVNGLVNRIQIDYPVKTYPVLLVGGGAEMLYKPIKNRIPNVELIKDSFLANAIGYNKIGRSIWG
ncbi:MAG: ParM/StbA family protein [Clostridium sp.]